MSPRTVVSHPFGEPKTLVRVPNFAYMRRLISIYSLYGVPPMSPTDFRTVTMTHARNCLTCRQAFKFFNFGKKIGHLNRLFFDFFRSSLP